MIFRSDSLWNGVSLVMAAMIHAGVAAWAAVALSMGNSTVPMGKPKALSIEINLAMIEIGRASCRERV